MGGVNNLAVKRYGILRTYSVIRRVQQNQHCQELISCIRVELTMLTLDKVCCNTSESSARDNGNK